MKKSIMIFLVVAMGLISLSSYAQSLSEITEAIAQGMASENDGYVSGNFVSEGVKVCIVTFDSHYTFANTRKIVNNFFSQFTDVVTVRAWEYLPEDGTYMAIFNSSGLKTYIAIGIPRDNQNSVIIYSFKKL